MPELENRHGIHFTSLIECTIKHLTGRRIECVGIMASPTTLRTRLYEDDLTASNIRVILPASKEVETIEACIRAVIRGDQVATLQESLDVIVRNMVSRGARVVLLGCTELSVIFGKSDDPRLIDPLTIITAQLLKSKLE